MKKRPARQDAGDVWQALRQSGACSNAWQITRIGQEAPVHGSEFGQWNEWKESGQLDWMLLGFPAHDGDPHTAARPSITCIATTGRCMNSTSDRAIPLDRLSRCRPSVLSFVRQGQTIGQMVALFNFTPVRAAATALGVPSGAAWSKC